MGSSTGFSLSLFWSSQAEDSLAVSSRTERAQTFETYMDFSLLLVLVILVLDLLLCSLLVLVALVLLALLVLPPLTHPPLRLLPLTLLLTSFDKSTQHSSVCRALILVARGRQAPKIKCTKSIYEFGLIHFLFLCYSIFI